MEYLSTRGGAGIAKFIENKFYQDFDCKIMKPLLESIAKADSAQTIKKNKIDPFSALIECSILGCSVQDWKKNELIRQRQKTLQNTIGDLHQIVIGSFEDWEDLGTGQLLDVVNRKKKIAAEIKNKHNTTKGSDKKAIYGNLKAFLEDPAHAEYTTYYVEMICSGNRRYETVFTPPNNITQTKEQRNEKILKVDGGTFLDKIVAEEPFITKFFDTHLPSAIEYSLERLNRKNAFSSRKLAEEILADYFQQAFPAA